MPLSTQWEQSISKNPNQWEQSISRNPNQWELTNVDIGPGPEDSHHHHETAQAGRDDDNEVEKYQHSCTERNG